MRTRRRIFAFVAACAVAFGSLWPLVSAAMPRSPDFPSFLCTQSGFQHPGTPTEHDDKFHCPLCVMSVDAAPPAVMTAPPVPFTVSPRIISLRASSLFVLRLARSPPSRAPPQHS